MDAAPAWLSYLTAAVAVLALFVALGSLLVSRAAYKQQNARIIAAWRPDSTDKKIANVRVVNRGLASIDIVDIRLLKSMFHRSGNGTQLDNLSNIPYTLRPNSQFTGRLTGQSTRPWRAVHIHLSDGRWIEANPWWLDGRLKVPDS